jgi:hypothetical protein
MTIDVTDPPWTASLAQPKVEYASPAEKKIAYLASGVASTGERQPLFI